MGRRRPYVTVLVIVAAVLLVGAPRGFAAAADTSRALLHAVLPLYDAAGRVVCTGWRWDIAHIVRADSPNEDRITEAWFMTTGHCATTRGGLWLRANGRLERTEVAALAAGGADIAILRASEYAVAPVEQIRALADPAMLPSMIVEDPPMCRDVAAHPDRTAPNGFPLAMFCL